MRSSTILSLLGASLAVATPVAHNRMHKKAVVYDIVTDIVYVTVTAGELPPPTTVHLQHTVYVNPVEASSSTTSSVEKPTSTYVAPAPATTSSTTSEAPAPTTEAATVETTTSEAPVETTPTTSAAAVVEVASTTSSEAAATTTAAAVSTSDDSFVSTGVNNHNTCRSSHSAENVSWNETLASYAATTAATCVFAHDMTEGGGGYGQNIASQGSSSSTAWTLESALENAIISEWYSEASLFTDLYGEESPSGSGDFLHFTQVVWKSSLEIGCAVQACPTSNSIFPGMYTWFTVCNYYPQGNVEGEFAENVLAS